MPDSADVAAQLQQTLEHAFASYRAGRLADAAAACREVLGALPREPNALHLLGIVHLMNDAPAQAAETLAQAAECQPDNAEIHNSLGAALRAAGTLDAAEASYRRAIKLNPGATQGYFNLGNTLAEAGREADAENAYRTVLSMDAHHADAIVALGGLAERTGETAAAVEWYATALALDDTAAEPHRRLGALLADGGEWATALTHLDAAIAIAPEVSAAHAGKGLVLAAMGRPGDAAPAFARALELDPGSAEALGNYAAALAAAGDAAAALPQFDKALTIDPGNADVHANLAGALSEMGRTDDALTHYDQALALEPRHADAWSSKAATLRALGRTAEALDAYDAAIEIAPEHGAARHGRSIALLSLGRLAEGWGDYRWRPSMRSAPAWVRRDPLADNLRGREILVVKDQGLGDELFFLRFVAALRDRGAGLTYHADPRIAAMIGRAGLFDRVADTDPSAIDFDRVVSIGDLPFLLAGEATPPAPEIPAAAPRLRDMADRLRAAGPAPYVGVTWRAGTPGIRGALSKEVPLDGLAGALRGIEGTVVVVQRDPAEDELSALADALGHAPLDLSARNGDLEDMLALMELLDDYVAVSNTNVHLRAARGRTCRVLVPRPGEFRWMAAGGSSPWFEGTAVYRETVANGWTAALDALRRDLGNGPG